MSRDQIQTLKEDLAKQVLELGLVDKGNFEKATKHSENTGASTFDLLIKDGDLTVEKLLKSLSVKYTIVGHSERRELFNESDTLIVEKIKRLVSEKMIPIYCCGEPLDPRSNNAHIKYVLNQIEDSIFKLSKEEVKNIIVAYEPIWAIGSGKTAELDNIQEMHLAIRKSIRSKFGNSISKNIPILYGGSVNPLNAKNIFDLPDVDGGLVGGASLNSQDFIDIVNSFN